ncbi:MAG: 1-(5-phosphoribosyl)-5-((5-phosphoribosylamino)methylideneamino)imidazole-4-carboxamide isomerase [Rhodanobacteraceae bacterium]|jgi:phosphoribosylformimino-5-aminoimidazole carboxamide ribotide isomerase|nr:1-(5-phosphoribosyl)-5-((5-phosphoribosylamino)methylideneamino)imidazole-4-carboxamide isomerase [Rhodanobacteraceae bacterium]
MKIIPAIDLRAGHVVRLKQGDFAQTRTFDHDPAVLAARYAGAGADWLHVVDLDGARAGQPQQLAVLARIAAAGARLHAGGGVRTAADVESLRAAGVARVVVGSVAVRAPDTFVDWLRAFGADALCLALDLRRAGDGRWRPALDAWQADSDADVTALLDRFADAGLRHVLSTDIAHDGMAAGPNLALYRELAARWPQFAWIASGGVRDRADVDALAATGVAACVAGTALLDGTLDLAALEAR